MKVSFLHAACPEPLCLKEVGEGRPAEALPATRCCTLCFLVGMWALRHVGELLALF